MAPPDKPTPSIYSDALSNRGYGHALWLPEGTNNSAEIQIGDVGYINKFGAFTFFFSIDERYKADKTRNMEKWLPPDECQYFDFTDLQRNAFGNFAPAKSEYYSRGVKRRDIAGNVGGGVEMANMSAKLSYTIEEDQGAICLIPEGATADSEDDNQRLQTHIKRNIERWYETLKKSWSIKLEDLIVIRGAIKAMQYQVTAIYGASKSKSLDISARAFELVNVGLSIEVRTKSDLHHESRSLLSHRDPNIIDPDKKLAMFLYYYKMKHRLRVWKKIEANAGPHGLPPGEDPSDDVMVVVDEDDNEISTPMSNQPVDALLDYILETCPDAERAFACEADVYSLYLGEELPDDILASLREKRPRIVVDENKIGTMVLEDVIRQERIHQIIGRPIGTVKGDDDEMVDPPMRDAPVTFRDSAGHERPLDWPHQHLSDKAQQQGSLKATAISPDDKLMAVGFDDATIILWDLTVGRVVSRPEGHEDGVYALAFSPNGTRLASGSADMKVIVWTVIADDGRGGGDITENDMSILEGHELDIVKVAYSPDGSILVSGSLDGILKIWDASNDYALIRNINNIVWPHSLSFTPDSKKLVTTMDNLVFVWDLTVTVNANAPNADTAGRTATMRGHDANVYMTAISHDGTRVATASEDQTARVWNIENGEELLLLHEHTEPVWCIAFSPDDNNVATGSDDMNVVVADSWTGERRHIFTDHPGFVNTICYSKSGRLICCGTMEGKVKLLCARNGEFIAEYEGHTDKIRSIAFSSKEDSIISSSEDGTIRTFSVSDILRLR